MADYEDDGLVRPDFVLSDNMLRMLWAFFDINKSRRIKLKWGIFRPSFKIAVLEPLFVKLIGPRPL